MSRTEILNALNHIESVRVPVDFGCHSSSGIMAIAYRRLRDYLGLPKKPVRVYDLIQQLAIVDDDVLDRFGVDVIDMGRLFCLDEKWWKEWILPDGNECLIPKWADVRQNGKDWYLYSNSGKAVGVQKAGSLYFEQIYWPFEAGITEQLPELKTVAGDVMWSLPKPPGPSVNNLEEMIAVLKKYRAKSDRAIAASFPGSMMGSGQIFCKMDNWLMWLAAEPEASHKFLDKVLEMHIQRIEPILKAIGSYIDVVVFADDMGMQTGPMVSKNMYREFFKPRHAALWKRTKEMTNAKILLHCCGGIYPLIEDFIDAGLDAINPVQTSCVGMGPERLKNEFGGKICFWGGGCDTQSVLANSTPEQVRKHVLSRLKIFSPGGGYVFNQIHNVMANVPAENTVAVYDAAAEYNARASG